MPSPWSLWILRGMTRPNPLLWIWYTFSGRPRRPLPHPLAAPDGASGGADRGARGGGVGGVNEPGNGRGRRRRGCLRGATGAVVLPRLHRPDRRPTPRQERIRAGNAEAGAARALRPRARRPDRALPADLSKGCVGAPGLEHQATRGRMIRRLFTRPRTVTPQRFSGNACRICGNTFAMALPTHYCDELTYLRMAAEWDR